MSKEAEFYGRHWDTIVEADDFVDVWDDCLNDDLRAERREQQRQSKPQTLAETNAALSVLGWLVIELG